MYPKLRFKGFDDAWEQRKLGEITGKVIGGGTPKTCVSEYWDGDIPWIQSSNVQENEMFDFDIPKSITQEGLEKSAAKLVPENSIAVVTHVGVGKLVFVPFSYTTSQDFTSLSELKTDAQFTCYSLYQRIKNDLHIVQGSAIKGITKDDLLSKEIMVPEIQEQRKIGNYFRKLDNLITLHQRELDSLKKLKKSLLQKMFPKNGEKIPELRFPEFTGDWEQRKLSDYLFTSKEKNVNNKYGRKDVYSVSGEFGVVNQIEFQGRSFAGKTLDGYDVIHKGEVVYTKSPLKSNPYGIIKTNKRETGIVSTLYAVYKPKDTCFANFVEDYFNSDSRTNRYLSPLISKGAKNTINVSDDKALDGIVIFPSTEEQRKISTYFEKLNNLITLHQRELDTLKKLKKGLLQNMFV